MVGAHKQQHVSDDERRDFLKALGVGGAVAVGSATLSDVREAVPAKSAEEVATIGEAIREDLTGSLDASLIASQQAQFADATTALPAVAEKGLPEDGARNDFEQVAAAGWPVYEHLADVGFFESTTSHISEFTPEYLAESTRAFVGSEALAAPLTELGLSEQDGFDLVATVMANAEQLSNYHWIATDQIPREKVELGQFVPPMTKATAGGVLLWLEDLDQHLWKKSAILTDEIVADAAWHGHAMAAGYQLMTEGAKVIADGEQALSESELGALLSTGFAVQAISQALLPTDVYWITDEMRGPAHSDVKPA